MNYYCYYYSLLLRLLLCVTCWKFFIYQELGFAHERCVRALYATNNNYEQAIEWIFQREADEANENVL